MKKAAWLLVGIAILISAPLVNAASPDVDWLGVLWTKGGVDVGKARVSSGTTIMPGDEVSTGKDGSAWVRFRSPASTVLMSDTDVVMLASNEAPSLVLRKGTMMVEGYTTDPMQVAIPGAFVLVKGTSQWGAECELATLDNTSTISVKRGTAEIHGKGAPILLQKGQTLRLEAGQQSGEKVAGRISKEIPQGKIQRMGQAEDLPLQLNQVIDWNDLLQTLEKGRAQIKLLDGSTLNVGARSELRIIKHDPEAQQTQLELTLGEVQANVQKITTPGGKFELRTKSAVIGTIDTSYVAETDGNQTKICGVDGTTLVGSTDPNITKTVKLLKNQCTTVMPGAPPTDPVFSPQEVAQMLNHTSIAGTGGAVGTSASTGAAGGAAGAAGGLPNWVWVAAGAAAGAAGGAITGIIVSGGGTTSPTTP